MDNLLKVSCSGEAEGKADAIVVNAEIVCVDKDYALALKTVTDGIGELKNACENAKIKKDELKTSSYRTKIKTKNVRLQDGEYKEEFLGYEVSQCVTVGFDLDFDKLSILIYNISSCKAKPTFSLAFIAKDMQKLKNMALQNACEKAKRKAEVLAAAMNVKLGDTTKIEHSDFGGGGGVMKARAMNFEMADCASLADINPSEIVVSQNVEITWEIK